MHAFDVLGDPVRRRILELLADREQASGAITAVIREEFQISQPAVSQHLRVLRDSGFATVRADGTRRLYAVDAEPLREVDAGGDACAQMLGIAAHGLAGRSRHGGVACSIDRLGGPGARRMRSDRYVG